MPPAETLEPTPEEAELARKLAELAVREGELSAREAALAKLEVELHVFEVQYLGVVGRRRYAELDELEAEIAELEASRDPDNLEALERAEQARARARESADALDASRSTREEAPSGPVPESLKKLFRKVARVLHPDLAEDAQARARRESLMAAANRAYLTGDETQLASILEEWEESPEAVTGQGAAAELLRAVRQFARVEDRLGRLESEIAALKESEMHALRARVESAEAAGRDLLAEMAVALEPGITAARARLETLLGAGAPQ